jgi:tRNA threonylcarbamoyladenosine biosynthesis protein TsaB
VPDVARARLLVAIETSSTRGGLSLFSGSRCLRESTFPDGLLHGRELTVRLKELLALEGGKAASLEAISVSVGPGSFTGTRVGVTAAKVLAFALRIPVVTESALRVLAGNALVSPDAPLKGATVAAVLDGRQGIFFWAAFRVGPRGIADMDASLVRLTGDGVADPQGIVQALEAALGGREGGGDSSPALPVLVIGDGADKVLERAASPLLLRGPTEWDMPRSSVLGFLTASRVAGSEFDLEAVHRLEPQYLRLSEAERRLAARCQGGAS